MSSSSATPTPEERQRRVRKGIIRSAVIWTPVFVALAGLWVFFLWDRLTGPEYGSTWFLMVVLTIFGTLFGVQSISALRDLFGRPAEETGLVSRSWTKRDSFVFKSYYIRMGKRILRGEEDLLGDVHAGDRVRVRYYQHSSIVFDVEKLAPPEQPQPAPEEEPAAPELPPPPLPAEPPRPRGRAERPEF